MAAIPMKKDSQAGLAADTMMHSEYLPMLANSVTKNPAAKDFSTRLASGRVTDERFAHKNSRADMPGHVSSSNDKFEAYGAKT